MHLIDQFYHHHGSELHHSLAHAIAMSDVTLLASIFKEWDNTAPSFAETANTVITTLQDQRSVNFSSQNLSAMSAAVELAAIENKNPYHGNTHFLKVFTLSALLGSHAHAHGRTDAHHLALLLSAALIHDLHHDGTNNKGGRYRLENIALNAAEIPLKQAGVSDKDWQLIKAFVYTTDVSKNFADPRAVSPAESVKKYSLGGNVDDLFPELRILADTSTSDMALMLEDADLGGGLLDPILNKSSGLALATEQGRDYDLNGERFFLEHICHRRMFSVSGHQLIQPHLNHILTQFGLAPVMPGQGMNLGLK